MRIIPLFFCLVSTAVLAGEFRYEIKGYPKQTNGCHATAANLGVGFEQATGISPTSSQCLVDTAEGYTIEINYAANEKLPLVSTSKTYSSIAFLGRYPSQAMCETALSTEKDIFTSETGLKVALAFCTVDGITGDKFLWYPRIDGFGATKKGFFSSGYQFFSVPNGMTGIVLRDKVIAGLADRGVHAVGMVFRSKMVYGEAAVYYYSTNRFTFSMNEYTKVNSLADCLAQDAEVDALFAGTSNPPLAHYCGKPMIGKTELNVLFAGEPGLRNRPSMERFASFEDCQSQRASLVDYYKVQLKLGVRGGLCSQDVDKGDYFLMLFVERK